MTAVEQKGIDMAVELMKTGWLNRYQPVGTCKEDKEVMCYLLEAERALAKYIGMKWCIGLNSGASAIYLAMKCSGLCEHGAPVLTNSFTFNAVPASIVHANCQPVLVECTSNYVIDLDDLLVKIRSSGSKVLVLSYMRGRIPDIDRVFALCEEHGVIVIEDAAHAYGCEWKGKPIGSFGQSSTISTQANKVINSGEGGFLLTNDDEIMARAICSAGCYEDYMLKHRDMMPDIDLMNRVKMECCNYSLRMTNLQGAIILPQVPLINPRREIFNKNYEELVTALSSHPRISLPSAIEHVTPLYDSLQFRVPDLSNDGMHALVKECKKEGLKLGVFGFMDNARNYKTWKFIKNIDHISMPQTDEILSTACDTRLDLDMTREDTIKMAGIIMRSVDATPASAPVTIVPGG